jgi:hypothetical protein
MTKQSKGQFYTVNSNYILEGFVLPNDIKKIVEEYMDKVFYSKEPSNALMLDLICKLYE